MDFQDVLVTASRVEIDGTTYAVRNINAIRIEKAPEKTNPAGILLVVGSVIAVLGLVTAAMLAGNPNNSTAPGWIIGFVGVLIDIPAIVFWKKLQPLREYLLLFTTTGRDLEALQDTNLKLLREIKEAIEAAIAES